MSDERTEQWALVGKIGLHCFMLAVAAALGAGIAWNYIPRNAAPAPAPVVPGESLDLGWKVMMTDDVRRYGLPEFPHDGMPRFKSQWRWMSKEGEYKYFHMWKGSMGNTNSSGEVEVSIDPLEVKPGKPGGRPIGESPPTS